MTPQPLRSWVWLVVSSLTQILPVSCKMRSYTLQLDACTMPCAASTI